MTKNMQEKGISLEVLGTCMTNTTAGSEHDAKVEYRHLWSYAQQAALIAVSDKNAQDGCYHLITDPERRAKRIAAHYACLYFQSAEKSDDKIQFYWPALAAFVVKDIVEAYRFVREDVLQRQWKDGPSIVRNSGMGDIGSYLLTGESPYQHALRTYSALAKGNLWLFMDIYPWLWFFLEYGINADGTLNETRLDACLTERNWNTYQRASKDAIEELPFGPNWMERLAKRLKSDVVYKKAGEYFTAPVGFSSMSSGGNHIAAAYQAHHYCRLHVKEHDNGYRTPPSGYWGKFKEAYYVMESEHSELGRMSSDASALAAIVELRNFKVTSAVVDSYKHLKKEYFATGDAKMMLQRKELVSIAEQEQVNVLQPLIYNDPVLKSTMDTNHRISRLSYGKIAPRFKVVYSSSAKNADPAYETVFNPSESTLSLLFEKQESLPDKDDRMKFVRKIAEDFNRLMSRKRDYMDGELRKILTWMTA